jgi:hypothetical protein
VSAFSEKKNEAKRPKLVLLPKNPERICWGCDKYCPADDLRCGNGTIRTPHPVELFGKDWLEWEQSSSATGSQSSEAAAVVRDCDLN